MWGIAVLRTQEIEKLTATAIQRLEEIKAIKEATKGKPDIYDVEIEKARQFINFLVERRNLWTNFPDQFLEKEKSIQIGDINYDGKIDAGDVEIFMRNKFAYESSSSTWFSKEHKRIADVNGDGEINALDKESLIKMIKSKSAG